MNICNYSFSERDQLLIDANIWMYIHYNRYPPREKALQIIYSREFEKIRQNQSKIYIDILILSEFINRYAKKEWEREIPPPMRQDNPFKEFRKGAKFKIIAKDIAKKAKRILDCSSRCDVEFSSLDIYRYLDVYGKGDSDFNDMIYIDLCKKNNYVLVTHDKDFKNYNGLILTANDKLYR
ncbi:MAG: type II toxin-antitoxin system VapC family toxin [Methanotrichaceae archaeon]